MSSINDGVGGGGGGGRGEAKSSTHKWWRAHLNQPSEEVPEVRIGICGTRPRPIRRPRETKFGEVLGCWRRAIVAHAPAGNRSTLMKHWQQYWQHLAECIVA